jgi:Protein of unknown function (DUF1496)
MIRRQAQSLLFGGAMTLLASGLAQAADPACVYQSRSYSEGAYICVQRSLMQTCTSDGARMVWRVIADGELNARCTAPLTFAEPRRRLVHRARPVGHAVAPAPAEPASAKCFVFNGKRYCE